LITGTLFVWPLAKSFQNVSKRFKSFSMGNIGPLVALMVDTVPNRGELASESQRTRNKGVRKSDHKI